MGCQTQQLPQRQTVIKVKDSIVRKLQVVDTLEVLRQADTAKINTLIHQLSEKPLIQRSKFATVKLSKVGNQIQAECITDEYKKLLQLQQELIYHYQKVNHEQQHTITIEKRYIPKIVKWLAWLGGILIVSVAIRIVKPKIPFLR